MLSVTSVSHWLRTLSEKNWISFQIISILHQRDRIPWLCKDKLEIFPILFLTTKTTTIWIQFVVFEIKVLKVYVSFFSFSHRWLAMTESSHFHNSHIICFSTLTNKSTFFPHMNLKKIRLLASVSETNLMPSCIFCGDLSCY